jgi:hypothetical protein
VLKRAIKSWFDRAPADADGAEPLGPRAVEKPLKEGWWQKYED